MDDFDIIVAPDFFTHSAVFFVHTKDVLNFANAGNADIRMMYFRCDELMPIHSVDIEPWTYDVGTLTELK